tara:strand:+ start:1074 stop:1910 length:837 start_codon:yes stop_codon:yes gene_type:complete
MGSNIEILISTYNGAQYLREQLNSLFSQTYHNFKILIRDDGSNDNTIQIVKEFAAQYSNKINLIEDDFGNLGSSISFMKLLEYSVSDYVMFCDQDDVWLPNKIEVTLRKIQEMEEEGFDQPLLVFSDLKVVDNELKIINDSFWSYQKIDPNIASNWKDLAAQNVITGCTIMFNKEAKNCCLPFELPFLLHDQWTGVCVSKAGKVGFIEEKTLLYRQHNRNVAGAQNYGIKYLYSKINELRNSIKYYKSASKYFKEVSVFELLYKKVKINLIRVFNFKV